jgi:hypothetical protein
MPRGAYGARGVKTRYTGQQLGRQQPEPIPNSPKPTGKGCNNPSVKLQPSAAAADSEGVTGLPPLELLRQVVPALRQRGYRFVRLERLLNT